MHGRAYRAPGPDARGAAFCLFGIGGAEGNFRVKTCGERRVAADVVSETKDSDADRDAGARAG
eukprot:5116695-Prymnesium_polylepis.1